MTFMVDVSVLVGIKRSDSREGLFLVNTVVNMRSLVVIYLLFYYAAVTRGTGNVVFTSKDFTNILKWDPAAPPGPGQEVRYSVAYERDTDKNHFVEKAECVNITERFCDLTPETPAVYDVHYRARVWADGSFYGQTNTFKPIAETVLGAPMLTLETTTTTLRVRVTLPLGPEEEPVKDIMTKYNKGPSKATVVYSLHITNPSWARQEIENTTGHFMVSLKNDQTEYCGYVLYKPAFEWGRPPSENTSFCITSPGNPWMVLPWPIMSVAVMAVAVAVAVCCVRSYVKDDKKTTPKSLDLFMNTPKVLVLQDVGISKVVISTKPSLTSLLDGYGPRNKIPLPRQEKEACSYDSSQSSQVYGEVTVQVEDEEDLFQLQTLGLAQTGPTLGSVKTLPQLDNVVVCGNSEAEPLLLDTQRGSDGQLILPMPSFEQKTFSWTTDPQPAPENKPRLSYLIVRPFVSLHSLDSSECSDSGCDESSVPTPTHEYCNSQYLPTQGFPQIEPDSQRSQSTNCGSAYKDHWMPSNNCGNSPYTWSWSGLKEEGEAE